MPFSASVESWHNDETVMTKTDVSIIEAVILWNFNENDVALSIVLVFHTEYHWLTIFASVAKTVFFLNSSRSTVEHAKREGILDRTVQRRASRASRVRFSRVSGLKVIIIIF